MNSTHPPYFFLLKALDFADAYGSFVGASPRQLALAQTLLEAALLCPAFSSPDAKMVSAAGNPKPSEVGAAAVAYACHVCPSSAANPASSELAGGAGVWARVAQIHSHLAAPPASQAATSSSSSKTEPGVGGGGRPAGLSAGLLPAGHLSGAAAALHGVHVALSTLGGLNETVRRRGEKRFENLAEGLPAGGGGGGMSFFGEIPQPPTRLWPP